MVWIFTQWGQKRTDERRLTAEGIVNFHLTTETQFALFAPISTWFKWTSTTSKKNPSVPKVLLEVYQLREQTAEEENIACMLLFVHLKPNSGS